MITQNSIYWLTRLDAIREVLDCVWLWMLMAFAAIVLAAFFGVEGTFGGNGSYEMFSEVSDDDFPGVRASFRKWCKRCVGLTFFCLFMAGAQTATRAFIPTSHEMAAIIVVPKIANSESVQTIGSELVDLAKEWLAELHPKSVKSSTKNENKEKEINK